jgi:hypothetical protein
MAVGERLTCARGDQGLHLLVIDMVDDEFGNWGIRPAVLICHGTPLGKELRARRRSKINRIGGNETRQARYRLIPTPTGSGTVDPTSQG